MSQLLLCGIAMQNIQIFYGDPVKFVVTCCVALLKTIEILKLLQNYLINRQKANARIVYQFLIFDFWFLIILSEYNIWALILMKCIIYQQSTCSFNVILRNNVKYYVILPTLFHTPFHMASKKCLAIVYLFEENCPNWLFAKVFIKKEYY